MLVSSSGGREPGQGNHASLSRFDMHNTLIAAGPDFDRGFVERSPSGNADLAPTILAILGIKPPRPMDGRVLTEAAPAARPQMLETKNGAWRQYLKITECGNAFYIDEGNDYSQVVHSEERRVTH
jgi:arylsulfatase A-like enzyme